MKTRLILASAVTAAILAATVADACTRAVYFGEEGQTVTGRTMDWFVPTWTPTCGSSPAGWRAPSTPRTPMVWTPLRQRRHHDL